MLCMVMEVISRFTELDKRSQHSECRNEYNSTQQTQWMKGGGEKPYRFWGQNNHHSDNLANV